MDTCKNKICIVGAGTWGTTLAQILCCKETQVSLVSASGRSLEKMRKERKHPKLSVRLKDEICPEDDIASAVKDCDVLFLAAKSAHIREVSQKLHKIVPDIPVISLAKGLDPQTGQTMCEVVEEEFSQVAALSGGSHAEEVIEGLPFTLTLGLPAKEIIVKGIPIQEYVLRLFEKTSANLEMSCDRKGVELAAAVKNVIAIAVGISEGLGLGDNFRSSLITKGLSKVALLGKKMGCQTETFYGNAGLGDLLATALSNHSRNRNFGFEIGKGRSVEEAKKSVGMVIEGLDALEGIALLERIFHVDLLLPDLVNSIVTGSQSPKHLIDIQKM